jgi:ribosomal protein S18 acetylase RimI-like enzyme/DNA-binding transcriptional ArsR family regulator
MKQEPDLIKELGELGFATRLKRLSERLMKDVSRIYGTLDVDFEARWFAVLYGLSRRSPLSVTALAQALGLTHTAVNQLAAEMMKQNLVRSTKDRKDDRKRLLGLTKKGRQVAVSLAPVWREIRAATKELIKATGQDILAGVAGIEARLDEKDMYERVLERMNIQPFETIEIVDYRPAYKKHFMALNREWLEKYFSMERPDREILSDPNGKIIRKGGAILFALRDGEAVGACALVKLSDKEYELTKMAVAPQARGRGIGTMLAEAIIDRARDLGATTLYLETSPRLEAAVHLYKKLGFRIFDGSPPGAHEFKRCTIAMKRKLYRRRSKR